MVTQKFRRKYRIESARLKGFDYASNGAYFITICTENREHFFGNIINGKMVLNDIAQKYWDEIPRHFPYIILDAMAVMPNHIHGILWIDNNDVAGDGRDVACNVSTQTQTDNKKMAKISPKYGSISTVIRSYKSVVTKNSREINTDFTWQPRFHDHIIRNEKSLNNIRRYIVNNPLMWERDRNNKKGLWL